MDTGYWNIFWPLILRGASMGFLFAPLSLATLLVLRGQEMPEGTALFNLARQLGGSIGIAVIATFVHYRINFHLARLLEHLTPYNFATWYTNYALQQGLMLKGSPAVVAQQQALKILQLKAQTQASIMGYEDVFFLMAFVVISSLPLLLLFEKGHNPVKHARTAIAAE